jgi:hypothetical protein
MSREAVVRKGLILGVTLGALAWTATAFGGQKIYGGSDLDSKCGSVPHTKCNISFTGVTRRNGSVKKVTDFVFDLIPDTCDQGEFAFTIKGHPAPDMKVDANRTFSVHYKPNPRETIDISGKFSKSYKSATGTVRDQGDFPPQATGCDTGTDAWKASKLNVTGG